ncbi:MAG: hypothetical protein FWG16_02760, partial [Micrococcales bacterium]|nr:hypothetical protein [Micrococcales bacterium]
MSSTHALRRPRVVVLGAVLAASFGLAVVSNVPSPPAEAATIPVWQDQSYSFAERAAAIVAEMTLTERVGQLSSNGAAVSRLGLGSYSYWNEAQHGVQSGSNKTLFPSATGMGSNWNKQLMLKIGDVIGFEVRYNAGAGSAALTRWAPTLNIARDPRWGRSDESYGEDPYLVGQQGGRYAKGMQGYDKKYLQAISTPKHYFANNSESNRRNGNSVMSERELREYWTPHFAYALGPEIGAYSYMTAYNRVNGVPMSASLEYLETMPIRQWGFKGFVTSDCSAVFDIYQRHKWQPEGWDHRVTAREGVAWALKAGLDIDCQGYSYRDHLVGSYEDGLVTDADVDREVQRLLEGRFRLGEFDPADEVPWRKADSLTRLTSVGTTMATGLGGSGPLPNNMTPGTPGYATAENSRQVAKQASDEAPVLLKNDPIPGETRLGLPLTAADAEIAVIGTHATSYQAGGYSASPPTTQIPNSSLNAQLIDKAPAGHTFTFGTTPPAGVSPTSSTKPGVNMVFFLDGANNAKGEATAWDPDPAVRLADNRVRGDGYPTSITLTGSTRPDDLSGSDLPSDRFLVWEGWMGIGYAYGFNFLQTANMWGGYFVVRHYSGPDETRICLGQSGTALAGGQF